jgi:hypothetical protein
MGYIMNAITLNKSSSAYLANAVSNDEKGSKLWVKAAEAFFADGIRAEHIATSKAGGMQDVYEFITASIIAGYNVKWKKLLAGDVKAMSDVDKAERRVAQQRLGTYRARLQKYLTDLAVESGEVEPEEKADKTAAEKLKIALETAQKIVQGDEQPKGYDPVIMAKLIGQALAIIKI